LTITDGTIDPEGDFVEVIGRNTNSTEGARVVIDHIKDWDGFLDESPRRRDAPVDQKESQATI